jgi:uncharacterized membrane protein YvlD (DUF360 family)
MSDRSMYTAYPMRLLLRVILTVILVWALNTFLGEYIIITGGVVGYIVVGSLLTLMNLFIRPVLKILSIPVRLFATLLAVVLCNGVFLLIVTAVADRFNPAVVTMKVQGGIGGWVVLAIVLGFTNWVMKLVLRT